MSILAIIRNGWNLGRKVKDNAAGLAAAEAAYGGDAAFPGIVLAFTGATPTAADNLTAVAVMEAIDSAHRIAGNSARTLESGAQTCELAAQTLAGAAHEARELEAFFARLKGGEPLRKVLEG